MRALIVTGGFKAQVLGLLTNDTEMTHTVYRAGNSLVVHDDDLERIDKILRRKYIKYTIK